MSNRFVNFLVNDNGVNLRDYQHANRLYVANNYALTPKPGWIYYVVLNINSNIINSIKDTTFLKEFQDWYGKNKGTVGILAKTVDMPKFTVETEKLNQYNRTTYIQKKLNYGTLSIGFHDDMSNVTTNLWKSYYQYYYGDSLNATTKNVSSNSIPKYSNTKYNANQDYYSYGLNNGQVEQFFRSIDVYQLHQKKYTLFKIVNPIIKDWSHDGLNQAQGNLMLGSKMTLEYETVIYNTSPNNKVTSETPGFFNEHYDQTPSPLHVGGTIADPLPQDSSAVFGARTNPGGSPLDLLNNALQAANLIRNAKNLSNRSLIVNGTGILRSTLSNINQLNNNSIYSDPLSSSQNVNPAGISVPIPTTVDNVTTAVMRNV